MDTAELLKAAMEAVKTAGVPKELQATALELAVADLRSAGQGQGKPAARSQTKRVRPAGGGIRKPSDRRSSPQKSTSGDPVLSRMPDEALLFKAIEKETGVSAKDLSDVFHVDDGRIELKIASRDLGKNKRAQTQTVTALLGGAVFAGTSERKLPFGEINRVCDTKHCLDSANSANSIKATSGFSSLGSGKSQVVTTKSGWQDEFANAIRRVLGRSEASS